MVKTFCLNLYVQCSEPEGISSLEGWDAVHMSQVNQLCSFCAETFDKCHRLKKVAM